MPLVSFLSDFGLQDHYVAAVKAVILREHPQQPIVDISHLVEPCNIAQAAFLLNSVHADFPTGSLHLVAVDTAGRRSARYLAFHWKGSTVICPDNGLITLLDGPTPEQVLVLPFEQEWPQAFPAKTVMAKAVSQLLNGVAFEQLGVPISDYIQKFFRQPTTDRGSIKGNVVYTDRYGNLITNIRRDLFKSVGEGRRFSIRFEHEALQTLSPNYGDVDFGDCLVLFNANDLLEIAINHGNASELLGMRYDSPVLIEFSNESRVLSKEY